MGNIEQERVRIVQRQTRILLHGYLKMRSVFKKRPVVFLEIIIV